jgi:hypothetical protein
VSVPLENNATPDPNADQDQDRIAAMLLGLGDDVPGGSTVVDLPAIAEPGAAAEDKKDSKKSGPTQEETSNAASEILRKYMRRPK